MSAFSPLSSSSQIARPKWVALFALGFFASLGYYAALTWLVIWVIETFGSWTSWL